MQDCISDFKEADIKVWMLTGDKGETAHQIAFSCGLYPSLDSIDDGSFKAFKFEDIPYGVKITQSEITEKDSKVIDQILDLDHVKTRFGLTISGSTLVSMLSDPRETERVVKVLNLS